jgi:hypothetical protein
MATAPASMLQIPASALNQRLQEQLEANEKLSTKLKRVQETGEAKAGLIVTGATIVVTEGALGYARGRYGEKKVLDIPAEVWAGGALELAAMSGLVGKHSEMVAAMGHATLAFVTAVECMKLGEKARAEDEAKTAPQRQAPPAATRREIIETQGHEVTHQTNELPEQRHTVAMPSRTMADDIPAPAVRSARKTG